MRLKSKAPSRRDQSVGHVLSTDLTGCVRKTPQVFMQLRHQLINIPKNSGPGEENGLWGCKNEHRELVRRLQESAR